MLRYLKIKNLAVIDEAELEIGDGFVCLTGESGAGKSVLIDALLLLSGARASADLVRTGTDKAVIEAEFELDNLPTDLELLEDQQLMLRREVTAAGKSRAFVNGVMVSAGVLARYAEPAFEIHGQHGQQRLLKAKEHRAVFENQTGLEPRVAEFEKQQRALKAELKIYRELREGEAARLKEIDFIRLQLEEIEEVNPNEKDAELDQQLNLARNQELVNNLRAELNELLAHSLVPDMNRAQKALEKLGEFQPGLSAYMEQMIDLTATLEELRTETDYWNNTADPRELSTLEERENALNKLYLKYGRNLEEVLAEWASLKQRLETLESETTGLDDRWAALCTRYQALCKAKARLHKAREAAVGDFCGQVKSGLVELDLKHADFQVENLWPDWPAQLTEDADFAAPDIQFLFSSNLGEPVKPLSKVASGGELSRVLLALIDAFHRPSAKLLVFDEIDAGLGGETAHAVGAKLAKLGRNHQVLCVTHFAQVARFVDRQIKIEKRTAQGRTFTSMTFCDGENRVIELARLLGGDSASESLREHARRLLEEKTAEIAESNC